MFGNTDNWRTWRATVPYHRVCIMKKDNLANFGTALFNNTAAIVILYFIIRRKNRQLELLVDGKILPVVFIGCRSTFVPILVFLFIRNGVTSVINYFVY